MEDVTSPTEWARRFRHYGLELLKFAADIEAQEASSGHSVYTPSFPIVDGVEQFTLRLPCCGAGADRADTRTGERLHLPVCDFPVPV